MSLLKVSLFICATLYVVASLDAWRDNCGLGLIFEGLGGLYIQTELECQQ